MKTLDNPFREGIALDFAPACNTDDRSLAGNIVMEKITPTPPGSAIPHIVSALTPEVVIDQKIQVRLSVCDDSAYTVKVAEFEF
jgi:hypothetical protein